jgi:hypothetical protein
MFIEQATLMPWIIRQPTSFFFGNHGIRTKKNQLHPNPLLTLDKSRSGQHLTPDIMETV